MKNLTKIFMAVAVAMFAFACVTDTTEDLGIEVGKGGVTEITVSLEESRTQLGERDADGEYPLYWSEGDAIAINGVASTPLAASYNGQVAASFTFQGVLTAPYSVVYPAPAEGVTAAEGLQPITFLAVQPYTEGTFVSGAAPMYGYSEGVPTEGIQLNHLTGVLRFAIKGENTLESIVITAEGKIAGNFDVNCQTGELTAHEDASNTVTVTFGEGLALGAEATPIYVAVPAGSHGLYTITLTSTDGKAMVVKYDSDAKPVKVGIVKEFGEILYAPSEVTAPEGELVISSEAEMKNLALLAEKEMLGNVTKVRVAATIDMSGVADWQPIAGFPAIEFDGGSDKGYTISGLTAPLFEVVTGATIKNVKLTGVNITENALVQCGALVGLATSSTINNCEAYGTLTYKNTTSSDHKMSLFGVGGLVGSATTSSTISNCVNGVDVTIEDFAPAKAASSTYVGVGGLVGQSYNTTDTKSTISNCTNLGNVISTQTNGSWQPAIGGIVGLSYHLNVTDVVNGAVGATDKGNITLPNSSVSCSGSGCIIGYLSATNVENATNYGTFTLEKGIGYPYIGGCFGTLISSTGSLKNVDNRGKIVLSKVSYSNGTPYFGGIVGRAAGDKWTLDDCDNYADLTIEGTFSNIKSNNMSCFGGIVGGTEGVIMKNCDNYANVTVKGTFGKLSDATNYGGSIYIGGVIGRASDTDTVLENCHFGDVAAATPNTLNVNVTSGGLLFVAGVAAYCDGKTIKDCGNHGNINITGETGSFQDNKAPNKISVFGGVIGYGTNADMVISGCTNAHNGDTDASHIAMTINYKANAIASSTDLGCAVFGGVFGLINSAKSATDCSNNCAINATINYNSTTGSLTTLGAFAGKLGAKAVRCSNGALGDISVAGTAAANVGVAGLNCSTTTTEDCSNAGDINVSVNNSTNGAIYINGLAWTGTTSANHTNFVNSGNITYTGKAKANAFISGMVYTPSGVLKNCQNKGTITANVNGLTCPLKIGGFVRSSSTATYDGCVNSGDIVFKGTSTSSVYLGGLCGDINGACKFTGAGFVNKGAIKFLGTTTSAGYAGGVAGAATVSMGETAVLKNEGTVTNYDATAALTGSAATVRWGGCFGSVSGNPQSVKMENIGDVYVRYSEKMGADVTIGGVAGGSSQEISNVTVCSDVAAIGFTESKASPIVGVGMVVGTHRSTTAPQVSNCVIGGSLALEEMDGKPLYRTISQVEFSVEDADGNPEPNPNYIPYWAKIYGGNVEWEFGSTYDGCTPHPTAPSSAEK